MFGEVAGADVNVAGAGVEVAGTGVEVAGAGVEVAGAGVEVAGMDVEAVGAAGEIAGADVEVAGMGIEVAGCVVVGNGGIVESKGRDVFCGDGCNGVLPEIVADGECKGLFKSGTNSRRFTAVVEEGSIVSPGPDEACRLVDDRTADGGGMGPVDVDVDVEERSGTVGNVGKVEGAE